MTTSEASCFANVFALFRLCNRQTNCRTLRFTFSYAAADAQRHRKMIEKDDSSFQAKKIHVANLQVYSSLRH